MVKNEKQAKPKGRKPMRNSFATELLRSVGTSWTRFLAIMGIVGLGVGFYTGLNMTGHDMRLAADTYYDGTHLYDLRVLSTLGLTADQVELIRNVDGVEDAAGDFAADTMIQLGDQTITTRITSFDVEAARASVANENGSAVESDESSYINRLVLAEGDWPTNADECLLSADCVMPEPIKIGDTVEVLSGTADIGDVFTRRTFKVTGLAHSSVYASSVMLGYTKLGSGMIRQCMYVYPEAFSEELPFTEVYVTVDGARDLESSTDEYQARVDEVAKKIEGLGLGALRLEQIKAAAESQLSDAESEYGEGKSKADKELSDAESKLESARKELEDGERQYAEGQQEYEAGKKELADKSADAERQLAEAREMLEQKNRELAAAEKQLGMTQGDINAARAEIAAREQQLADAERQLGMSQKDIDNARSQLKSKENEVADAERQLAQAQRELDDARSQLASGSAQWESQRSQLTSARNDLGTVQSALNAVNVLIAQEGEPSAAQIADARKKLNAALGAADRLSGMDVGSSGSGDRLRGYLEQVASGLQNVDFTQDEESIRQQIRDNVANPAGYASQEIGSMMSSIDSGIAQADSELAAASARVEQAQAQVQSSQNAVSQGKAAISDAKSKLDQAQNARNTIDAGYAAIRDAKSKLDQAQGARNQIDSGSAQLDAAWKEFYQKESSAREQLSNAQKVLDAAAEKLSGVAEQLAAGRKEYEEGLKNFNNSRAEVESRLADAAAQLAAARGDVNKLAEPTIYVLDRLTNVGVVSQNQDTHRIDSIGTVFPFIFFLVAALVSLTTMTRMVEDERVDIGTHKALGFTTSRITAKYVCYAGMAGLLGGGLFILILTQLIPFVLQTAYAIMYNVPSLPLPLPIDLGKALSAMAIGLGVTFVAIYGAAATTLREVTAALLMPRAPKAGKRILLERIGFIWSNLSFSWKVTFRNLFRYKQRFIMTVIGVCGCTALLLTGFGLRDAIWDILEFQFLGDDPIQRFNTTISLSESATSEDIENLEKLLVDEGDADGITRIDRENMLVSTGDKESATSIVVFIINDPDSFKKLIKLRDRISGEPIEFDSSTVLLTEKSANLMGVTGGSTVTLFDQDEIGNAMGSGYEIPINGVVENYAYNYLYVGVDAWRDALDRGCIVDAILANVKKGASTGSELSDKLSNNEAVENFGFSDETINTYRTSLQAINMIVIVLVAAAGTLAFIVLYNLTNIQLIERVREIASLKVLGFNRQEVASYLFRETLILVIIGALVGLGAGTVLESYVVQTAETDAAMFVRYIHPSTYFISFGLTIVFSLVVMLIISPKLQKIDMVESLKSVD